jgi:tetratricopeptide (TPR) repeat protein
MKKKIALVFITIVASVFAVGASAQGKYGADSAECIKYLSYYREYYKQKNYKDAMPNWRQAYKLCPPTASQNLLIHGSTLMQQAIASEKDDAVKSAMIDTLLTLQDLRAQYYPKYAQTAINNKGLYIAKYIKDPQKLYNEYNKIIDMNQEKTVPNVLLLDLQAAIDLYKDNKIQPDEVISTYQKSLALLEKAAPGEENDKAKSDLQGLFVTSQVASCDNLISLFTPRFEANPDDLQTIKTIVSMMASTEGCQDNDLFLKAVTKLYEKEPSASSAYYLYRLYSSHNDVDNAIKYMEEAINSADLESSKKAEYCVELAAFGLTNKRNSLAFDYAKKAAEIDPATQGKAYYLIGTLWGSVTCGGDEVAKRSKYWVAVDYLQKAKSADPSLTEDCNKLIGQYSVYYPEKADAFMYDVIDGQSYSVNCGGMHATTTVRTR